MQIVYIHTTHEIKLTKRNLKLWQIKKIKVKPDARYNQFVLLVDDDNNKVRFKTVS